MQGYKQGYKFFLSFLLKFMFYKTLDIQGVCSFFLKSQGDTNSLNQIDLSIIKLNKKRDDF